MERTLADQITDGASYVLEQLTAEFGSEWVAIPTTAHQPQQVCLSGCAPFPNKSNH
jgi:hypothetical protein